MSAFDNGLKLSKRLTIGWYGPEKPELTVENPLRGLFG